ncbi:MAG: GTPase, partial [Deltaproteobacteria bacterium]
SIPLAASLTKFVPAAGMTLGVVSMPIVAGATTYAIAKVFVQHFASGGTFLSFDPEMVKDYYAQMFKEGQKVAAEMK